MALRRTLSKRLFSFSHDKIDTTWHLGIPNQSPITSSSLNATSVTLKTLLELPKAGVFRRFLHLKRGINQSAPTKLPEFLSITLGDKLREKLRRVNIPREPILYDGVLPAAPEQGGIAAADARKILRSVQLEKIRFRLKEIPANSISYNEYIKICGEACDQNHEQGLEFAKKLDEAGSVIIVGDVVFLRPDQVAISVEKMIAQSVAAPNDPRRRELEEMEKQKATIDQKAQSQVKGELQCGLGFLVLQTLGFMRLTFWELSWDVMEPICFFVTSLHFALAYGFFLRTSKEPTFEGYFQRRFRAKQRKLMQIHSFDVEKYEELCRAFYPSYFYGTQARARSLNHVHENNDHARRLALSSI